MERVAEPAPSEDCWISIFTIVNRDKQLTLCLDHFVTAELNSVDERITLLLIA